MAVVQGKPEKKPEIFFQELRGPVKKPDMLFQELRGPVKKTLKPKRRFLDYS